MTKTYREQFSDKSAAAEYERTYTEPTYSNLLWEIEKDLLTDVVSKMRTTHQHIEYLDFAAGSGRVISFVEDLVDSATGIEISPAMAAIAQEKLDCGTMIVKDITADEDEMENQYDLITTFRFILNAEPALRIAGMKALVKRLRNQDSMIVFDNHGSLLSHKALMWPVHKIRTAGKGYQTEGNYLTDRQVQRLAREVGLRIERSVGFGVLSAKALRLMSYQKLVSTEKKLARGSLLSHFGCNRLYVARKA